MSEERLREFYLAYNSEKLRQVAGSVEYRLEARRTANVLLEERGEAAVNISESDALEEQPQQKASRWGLLALVALLLAGLGWGIQRRHASSPGPPLPLRVISSPQVPMRSEVPPLHRAAIDCNVAQARAVLKEDEDPNRHDSGELFTYPLTLAARGCEEVVALLLEHGARVNVADGAFERTGHSPLTVALLNTQYDIVELLLAAGADPNQRAYGIPPVHHAIESFPILVNYDPTRHDGVANDAVLCIAALVRAGADLEYVTEDQESLVDLVDELFDVEARGVIALEVEPVDGGGRIPRVEAIVSRTEASVIERQRFYEAKRQEILAVLGGRHAPSPVGNPLEAGDE